MAVDWHREKIRNLLSSNISVQTTVSKFQNCRLGIYGGDAHVR
jgi:hypothetical protein